MKKKKWIAAPSIGSELALDEDGTLWSRPINQDGSEASAGETGPVELDSLDPEDADAIRRAAFRYGARQSDAS